MERAIQPIQTPSDRAKTLREQLDEARRILAKAEAELAAEQAEVNRFRMHCRLKIGDWVDQLLTLQSEKQTLLTELQLKREGLPFFDEDDPFWDIEETDTLDILLPTDVPEDKASEKRLYRSLVKRFHPDAAGGGMEKAYATTIMAAVNAAYEAGDMETLRGLAGELNPDDAAEYAGDGSPEVRKLNKLLQGCMKRRRKVTQQLKALRVENTARLYRKAQRLEEAGEPWWSVVREELEEAVGVISGEIEIYKAKLEEIGE